MHHFSFLSASLLFTLAISPAFAAEPSDESISSTTSSNSKFATKSSEVVKKLTVNASASQADEEKDPFEAWNRKVYQFNDVLDRNVARPIAVQYSEKVPEPVRGSYRQFRKNLNEPWNAVNQLVQGRPMHAAKSLGRFTINTLTTLGFADPARRLHLTAETEGFGTTLGYYGVPTGPYLVLPILGPSTIRETVGFAADSFARPQRYILEDHKGVFWAEQALRAVDSRAELLDLEKVLQGDKYAQIRDIYLQRLNFIVAEKKGLADENMFISDEGDDPEDESSDPVDTDFSDDHATE